MAGDGGEKGLSVQGIEPRVAASANGCRARDVVEEGDLAEVVAASEPIDSRSADGDVDLAVRDHVEPVADIALGDQLGPCGRNHGRERTREGFERRRREWSEERYR